MAMSFSTTRSHCISPIRSARLGKSPLAILINYSFTLYKEVEQMKIVERKFAKALSIPAEHVEHKEEGNLDCSVNKLRDFIT